MRGVGKFISRLDEKVKSVRIDIVFMTLLIVAFLSLAGRCFYLQFFRNDYYRSACARQHRGRIIIRPQRGVILDCRGRVLAASNKIQAIFAEPRIIKDAKDASNELAPIVNIGAHEICKLITESNNQGYVKIKVGADAEECKSARRIYGIGVESDWQRHYPMGGLAAHVVGFTSVDNRGLGGIEAQYNKELSGSAGRDFFLADAFRRPLRPYQGSFGMGQQSQHQEYKYSQLKDGVGIILTIDATIQQFALSELKKQYESYEAESAVAIVVSVASGEILAMVSLPDFEPGEARYTDPNTFCNRAITDQFEPGSVLKPIAAAIAIDNDVVTLEEKIFCERGHYHGKGFGHIGEYGNHEFGDFTVREILVHSSNIGMAKIGQRLGKGKLYRGLKLFGFGKRTGIDLPGEGEGLLWPVSKWTGYSVTRIPFGQEISVTAIQLIRAFCILANEGRPVRLHVVKAIVDNDGEISELNRPALVHSDIAYIVKPEVAKWIVTEALTGVVEEGTGKKAKLDKWQVFGKTGTANIAKSSERGYSERDYIASFVAGAPAEQPAVMVLVSIRKPNIKLGKGYTGGTVAAPVAGKILEKALNYLERKQY